MVMQPEHILTRAQACYRLAYMTLPSVLQKPARLLSELRSLPRFTIQDMYVATCGEMQIPPDESDFASIDTVTGELPEGGEYFVIRYPRFSLEETGRVILPPLYSAILLYPGNPEVLYYVLGTSPAGGTTLRKVTASFNANLGPGPDASLKPLLDAILALQRS